VALLLIFVFIVLPIAELYVIIQVGQAIGVLPTLALLLIDGIVGAALARSQGRIAWRRFNETMGAGRIPGKEVFDGALVIFGGALLLSPGFITDILGFLLLIPPSRALIRAAATKSVQRGTAAGRVFVGVRGVGNVAGGARRAGTTRPQGANPPPPRPPRPPRRPGYDVEGTAREIPEDDPRLEGGERSGDGR
jgi:UPF0716 protein FxsA